MLGDEDGVQLQLVLGELDGGGCRSVAIYSRPQGVGSGGLVGEELEWTRHAVGSLSAGEGERVGGLFSGWPECGRRRVLRLSRLRVCMSVWRSGYRLWPGFQGFRAVWRRGEQLFAEVSLAGETVDPVAFWLCILRCSTQRCMRCWLGRLVGVAGVMVRGCALRFRGVVWRCTLWVLLLCVWRSCLMGWARFRCWRVIGEPVVWFSL